MRGHYYLPWPASRSLGKGNAICPPLLSLRGAAGDACLPDVAGNAGEGGSGVADEAKTEQSILFLILHPGWPRQLVVWAAKAARGWVRNLIPATKNPTSRHPLNTGTHCLILACEESLFYQLSIVSQYFLRISLRNDAFVIVNYFRIYLRRFLALA